MRVLLVEPNYKRRYLPLGLLKIAGYHRRCGDEVRYTRGIGAFDDAIYDKIYITSLFTWDLDTVIQYVLHYSERYPDAILHVGGVAVSIRPDDVEKATGIKPHVGLFGDFENEQPDYSIFPEGQDADYRIGFTSRGCPNKCPWCMVRFHEPHYIELKDWEKRLGINKQTKRIILWDNNFLAASRSHFDDVIDKLAKIGLPVDFNQGLDCRLMDEYKARRMSELRLTCIRFAFDTLGQDGFFQKAMRMMRDSGVTAEQRTYMLYNFMDKPEDLYYRLREVRKCEKAVSFPMKYQDFDAKKKGEYVGKYWTMPMLKKFKERMEKFYDGAMVGHQSWDVFHAAFGKDREEFMRILHGEMEKTDKQLEHERLADEGKVMQNARVMIKDECQGGLPQWM